ncbi:MAG TPA: rhomboid family intramembrane serine protease [Chloroflexota bacterium]|nr:rhomboid family intramembrane serine protease [Chloroflexota bacterium]
MIPISDSPRRRSFPWVTILIIALNIAVFLYELTLNGTQLDRFTQSVGVVPVEISTGRDIPPADPGPVYVTLLTSMFVHGGFLHIASNMLYLWVFGDNVEDAFGHLGYLLFYLVTGVVAGLTQVLINTTATVPSIGASGAIAGVLGAYLLLYPRADVRTILFIGPFLTVPRISALFLIGFWFLTQLLSGVAALEVSTQQTGGVAFWAHIGGFISGFVLALVFRPRRAAVSRTAW